MEHLAPVEEASARHKASQKPMISQTQDNANFTAPTRRMDLTFHEIDGEALIYDPNSADTHRFNSTALFIWQCCDGQSGPVDIAEKVMDCYEVTYEEAIEHVHRTLVEFRAKSLLASMNDVDAARACHELVTTS